MWDLNRYAELRSDLVKGKGLTAGRALKSRFDTFPIKTGFWLKWSSGNRVLDSASGGEGGRDLRKSFLRGAWMAHVCAPLVIPSAWFRGL